MLIVVITSGIIFLDSQSTSALDQYCEPGYRRYYTYKSIYDLPENYTSLNSYPLLGNVSLLPYEYGKLLVVCKRYGFSTRLLSKSISYDSLVGGSNMQKCPYSLKEYTNTSKSIYKFRRNGTNVELCYICEDSVPIQGKSLCKTPVEIVDHCDYYTRWLKFCVVCEPDTSQKMENGTIVCKPIHHSKRGQLALTSSDMQYKTKHIEKQTYSTFSDPPNDYYNDEQFQETGISEVGAEEIAQMFELAYKQVNEEEPSFWNRNFNKAKSIIKKNYSYGWEFLKKYPTLYISQYAMYVVLKPSTLLRTVTRFIDGKCMACCVEYKSCIPCDEMVRKHKECAYRLAYDNFMVAPLGKLAETSITAAKLTTWLKLKVEDFKRGNRFGNGFANRLVGVFKKKNVWAKLFDLIMLETDRQDTESEAEYYSEQENDHFSASDYIDTGSNDVYRF